MTGGRFITFEGGDGVGKTTQIARLAQRLEALGIAYLVTREPGGTPFAERLRAVILDPATPEPSPLAEALLFGAARQDHVARAIAPARTAGKWVLCDRFADSTRAYQGAAGGVEPSTLRALEAITHPGCRPDLTIILDLAVGTGRDRRARRSEASQAGESTTPDRYERRDEAFQERLRAAFLEIAAQEPERCRVVDAARTVDEVHADIWAIVRARFTIGAA